MNAARVRIAIPSQGTVSAKTARRLQEIRDAHPDLPPVYCAVAGIGRTTRLSKIARWFLQGDGEILLIVAPDVVPPLSILELWNDDHDIVGFPPALILNGESPARLSFVTKDPSGPEVMPCAAVLLRCVAIKRRVLEHPEMAVSISAHMGGPFGALYDTDGIEVVPPDVTFCMNARRLGFTVAVDFRADNAVKGAR